MNIITNYQAREIALQSKKRKQEDAYINIKEFYKKGGNIKSVVDGIFDNIKLEAEKGEFVSVVDIKLDFQGNNTYRESFGKLLVDALEYLGYRASYSVLDNKLIICTHFS